MSFEDWFRPGPTDVRPRPGSAQAAYRIGDIGVGSLVVAIERGDLWQGQLDWDATTPRVLVVTNVYPDTNKINIAFAKAHYAFRPASSLRLATAEEIKVDAERSVMDKAAMLKRIEAERSKPQ